MVIDDVISTIKEINKRDGYVPVGLKACRHNEHEERLFYMSKAMEWIEHQLIQYRIEHGLEVKGIERCI